MPLAMANPYPPRRWNDAKVAILCALNFEADMVQSVFDTAIHRTDYYRARQDENHYSRGVIGAHSVVLVHMPGMGTTTAAAVIKSLGSSFRNIEIVFVVGICGVVPVHPETGEQIKLGDCVISTGVKEYDFGRQYPDMFVEKANHEDVLGRARPVIRSLLAKLSTKSNTSLLTQRQGHHLENLQRKMGGLAYPGTERDKLFDSNYIHQHREQGHRCAKCLGESGVCGQDCDSLGCDDTFLVNRGTLAIEYGNRQSSALTQSLGLTRSLGVAPRPKIHFGLYGSSNTVMKSGARRDFLASEQKIAALEMEGAGAWEHFPTLIVKAGCDYADSHKNKEWQDYAAASAAAALKAILEQYEPSQDLAMDDMDIDEGLSVRRHHQFYAEPSSMQWLHRNKRTKFLTAPHDDDQDLYGIYSGHSLMAPAPFSGYHEQEPPSNELSIGMKRKASTIYSSSLHEILGIPLYEDPLDRFASTRLEDTCGWIFENTCYQDWLSDSSNQFLWLYGGPGTGKTIMCATIIKQLQKSSFVLHYFSSAHNGSKTLDVIIRHWLSQIARYSQDGMFLVMTALQTIYHGHVISAFDTWKIFGMVISYLGDSVLVLDGFDEYDEVYRIQFLNELKRHAAGTSMKAIIVSRKEAYVQFLLAEERAVSKLRIISYEILTEDTQTDVQLVTSEIVKGRLPGQSDSLQDELTSTLTARCDGMFLWVELAAKRLNEGTSKASLRRIVDEVPAGLNDLYKGKWQDILREPNKEERTQALRILAWCTYALKPLTVSQLTEAIVIQPDDSGTVFQEDELIPVTDDFIKHCVMPRCGAFIRFTDTETPLPDRTVHVVHASAREFLVSVLPLVSLRDGSEEVQSTQNTPHLFLSKVCLRYLSYKNISGSANLSHKPKWVFHKYANDYWNEHFESAQVDDQEFYSLASRFLDNDNANFTNWSTTFEKIPETSSKDLQPAFQPGLPLYYAVVLGMVPVVQDFLKSNTNNLDHVGGKYGTALQAASDRGNKAMLHLLLDRKANVDVEAGAHGTALIAAAVHNHQDIVEELLTRGADVNKTEPDGGTAAFYAAISGQLKTIEMLVASGADINIAATDDRTPLIAASRWGRLDVARYLLNNGANMNCSDYGPLHHAAEKGHLEIARLLVCDYGVDVNAADSRGCTPLFLASECDQVEMADWLISHGAHINTPRKSRFVPLIVASRKGHIRLTRLLLENHAADITVTDTCGCTPLLVASGNPGQLEIEQLLLSHGADPNTSNDEGWTPLVIASLGSHLEIVKLLLDNGAHINATDPHGCTPLRDASRNGHLEVVRLLLSHGPDLNITNKNGWTPLNSAARNGYLEIVRLLLNHGAAVDIANNAGWTPLKSASYGGHLEIVQLLLNRGVDVNSASNNGWTPLHSASSEGHPEIVRILLRNGANLNLMNGNGHAPILTALYSNHTEIVRLLLDGGADVSLASDHGETLMYAASGNGNIEVVRLLLGRGFAFTTGTTEESPLFVAVRNGHLSVVEALLDESLGQDQSIERKEAINRLQSSTDDHGRSVLHLAAKSGNIKLLNLLVHGELLPAEDKFGRNTFDYACMSGSTEMVEKVLEMYRSDKLDIKSSSQWSPLHWACRNGSRRMLEVLAESKTQSWEVDTSEPAVSWSALDIAIYWSNTNLIPENADMLQPWYSTLTIETNAGWNDSASQDALRLNNLGPQTKAFQGYCDGCYSDVLGHRFRCQTCQVKGGFDYCFMCKHGSELAHPGHTWKCIEPPTEDGSTSGNEHN